MSVDNERGLLFLPIGSSSYDFYGADRKGDNLFSNSLVALNAATGKLVWFYQMVHHDIWDYDLPAQPVLIIIHRDKKEIPAVAQVTKMGYVFILDRVTGKPLFPVEERPFPKSTVLGESASPTQPVPLKPPPLARQSLSANEITNVTPESQKYCAEFFKSLEHHGMYGPYSQNQTLVFPGSLGGANWSGATFDPTSGYLFVNINELGAVGGGEGEVGRPDLRQAEQILVRANANIGVAKAEFFPQLSLTALFGRASPEVSALTGCSATIWSVAGMLSGPIFDGGRNLSNYRAAQAQWEQAKLQYEQAVLTALREVSDALTLLGKLSEAETGQERAVKALAQAVEHATDRYRRGFASYYEVLEAQQQLYPAQNTLAQIRHDRLLEYVQLYKVLGGGWSLTDAEWKKQAEGSGG